MYTINECEESYIVLDGAGLPSYWLVREGESAVHDAEGQDELVQYLTDAEAIFKSELGILLSTSRTFTEKDEGRLKDMLRLLIDARKTWQEEEIAQNGACCD